MGEPGCDERVRDDLANIARLSTNNEGNIVTHLRAVLAALVLSACVLFGGCAQNTSNTAAVVNGVVIRESTVNDMAKALVATGAYTTYAEARSASSSTLFLGEAARQVAGEQGIALTQPDFASLSTNNPTFAPFLGTPLGVQYATDYMNAKQVINQISNWRVEFAPMKVELNPRYGKWTDYLSSGDTTTSTGSLSALSGS